MELEKLHILIVDDHPLMVKAYKTALIPEIIDFKLEITTAFNCETAFNIITDTVRYKTLDLILLDRSLPVYEDKKIYSGEDLALLIRKYRPKSKIIMSTLHTGALLIYNIIAKIAPDGLLIKGDLYKPELLQAFNTIMKGNVYHSATVQESIKKVIGSKIFLDADNRDILSLIAKRIKIKDLPNYIPLSPRTIDGRKAKIKDILGVSNCDDRDLIIEAEKLGFI